jgi:hypothetical protein
MIKQALVIGVMLVGSAAAQQIPYLMGSVNNRANGQIYFTTSKTNCGERHFAFIRGDGGEIQLRGCYVLGSEFIVVTWDDGDTYTYDYAALKFTADMERYLESKK